jgi:3-methyladenine DNA glycosylase AlkC
MHSFPSSNPHADHKHSQKNPPAIHHESVSVKIESTFKTLDAIDVTQLPFSQVLAICRSIAMAIKRLHNENKSLGTLNIKNILIGKDRHEMYVTKFINTPEKMASAIDKSNDIYNLRGILHQWCPLLKKYPLFIQTLSDDDKLSFNIKSLIERITQLYQLVDYFNDLKKKSISSTFTPDKNITNIIKNNHYTATMLFELCKDLTFPEYLIRDIMLRGDIFDLLPDVLVRLPKQEAVTLLATCPFPTFELDIFISSALQNANSKSLFDIIDATKTEYPDFYSEVFKILKKPTTAKNLLIKTEQPDVISELCRLSEMVKYADHLPPQTYQKILSMRAAAHPEEIAMFIDTIFYQDKSLRTFDKKLSKTLAFLDTHLSQDKNLYEKVLQNLNKKYRTYLLAVANQECLGFYSLFGHSRGEKIQASLRLEELMSNPNALKAYQATHPVTQTGQLGEIAKRLTK